MGDAVQIAVLICLVPLGVWFLHDPAGRALPVYAALVPVGGVVALPVPLPAPFNSVTSVVGAMLIGAIVAHLLRHGRGNVPTLPVAAWLLFTTWAIVTLLWASDLRSGLLDVQTALPLIVLLLLVAALPTEPRHIRRLRFALVAGGSAVGAYAAFVVVAGRGLPSQGVSERFSLAAEGSGNPNQLAAALIFPLMASLDMVLDPDPDRPRRERVTGIVGLVLTSVAVLLSGSRGGVVAAVLSFAVGLFLSHRWRPWSRPRVQTVVIVSAATLIVVVSSAFTVSALFPESRLAAIVVSDPIRRLATAETGSSGRAEIWTGGLLACRSACAVGAGVGGFRDAYADVFPFSSASRNVGTDRPAHNVYLEMAVELGVVGLVLFGAAVALEWWSLRRLRDSLLATAAGAAVAGVLITNVFEGFLWFKHAWLPFLAIRVIENARDAGAPALSLAPFTAPAHGRPTPAVVGGSGR